jgi:hypothetical protein
MYLINNLKEEKQAFITHYNYSDCLECLTNGVSIKLMKNLNRISLPKTEIDMKKNLIELTLKSLEDEYKIVQQDKNYSYASTSWLPVKTYYLIFNLMLTIEYIIQVQKNVFNYSHVKCIEEFTRKLEKREIEFNEPLLNIVFDQNILALKEVSGANLSKRIHINRRFKMAIKKVANYKLDEWKRKEKISLRSKLGRNKKSEYLKKFKISIFEFPYYMRIRSNYRDFAFIEGVTVIDTAKYFNSYYNFSLNLYYALIGLKKYLLRVRGFI